MHGNGAARVREAELISCLTVSRKLANTALGDRERKRYARNG